MFLSELTDRGPTPALVHTITFTQARLKTIAENIANWQTPGYRAKQLDPKAFQASLRDAIEQRGSRGSGPMMLNGKEVRSAKDGSLTVTAREKPLENVLFHDGTNLSIEREMAELAETGMTHELATSLLRRRFEGLTKAIRGTV